MYYVRQSMWTVIGPAHLPLHATPFCHGRGRLQTEADELQYTSFILQATSANPCLSFAKARSHVLPLAENSKNTVQLAQQVLDNVLPALCLVHVCVLVQWCIRELNY